MVGGRTDPVGWWGNWRLSYIMKKIEVRIRNNHRFTFPKLLRNIKNGLLHSIRNVQILLVRHIYETKEDVSLVPF